MLGKMLENVRKSRPIVHCITNYVTANDCANILLACGASPIMACDEGEVEDIASLCGGLVLNIGTLRQAAVPAMLKAGRTANALGIPVVFDPVGAGASRLRTATALELLRQVHFTVIRGNISEVRALARSGGAAQGVDAAPADRVTEETLPQAVTFVRGFARRTGAVVAVTGAIDLVSDGEKTCCIRNGCPELSRVTGTGCQLSALAGAFAAANPDHPLEAAAAAVCAMGLAGELAKARLTPPDGTGTFRNYLLDAVSNLTAEQLRQGANYEMR